LANGNVGASDLQQAQLLAKEGLCKHWLESQSRQSPRSEPTAWLATALEVKRDAARELAETASCKDEDADEASGQLSNHDVYIDNLNF
jgi:hypothetical protein